MAIADRTKKELTNRTKKERAPVGFRKSKSALLPLTSLASFESLSLPLVHEVVFLADFQCAGCQKRVADVISRMNCETQSVEVSVLEKKVTLVCRYSGDVKIKVPAKQVTAFYGNPLNKVAMIKRFFGSYCG